MNCRESPTVFVPGSVALVITVLTCLVLGALPLGDRPLSQVRAVEPLSDWPSLPKSRKAMPTPYRKGQAFSGFKLRGIKGWGWTPEQYLAEIPVLAKYRMNFLMNCYLSMYTDPEKYINNWWEPIPGSKRAQYEKVVKSCQKHGIQFCFALNPQLSSSRPYDYSRPDDYAALWAHYRWMQGLGVKWFSLSLDDIDTHGTAPGRLAEEQVGLANRLVHELQDHDPEAKLIFCPTYYWGIGTESEPGPYWDVLAKQLDSQVILFWTGPSVYSLTVTRAQAKGFKDRVRHEVVLWDNYPVNDRNATMHLGPLVGRDPELPSVLDGYMSNPMAHESEINRLPLITCADFAYNPQAYDPDRSIGQSILDTGTTRAQRQTLRDLVSLYPGRLRRRVEGSQTQWPVEDFRLLSSSHSGRDRALQLLRKLESVDAGLKAYFPGRFAPCKSLVDAHLARLKKEFAAAFGQPR